MEWQRHDRGRRGSNDARIGATAGGMRRPCCCSSSGKRGGVSRAGIPSPSSVMPVSAARLSVSLGVFVVMMLVGRLGNTLWYAICNGKQIMANNGNADDDIMPA